MDQPWCKMPLELIATTFAAGMLYVLIPGPATLAALSLAATSGRGACARFLAFHLLGDLTWAILAISAILGISQIGPLLFDVLGIACGCYLVWLGFKALLSTGTKQTGFIHTPWKAGLIFGFTNPKAYPFALAMFTAVFARFEDAMTFQNAVPLVLAAFGGFSFATVGVVFWTSLPVTRRVFSRYGRWITRAIGVVFIAAGAKSIVAGVGSIRLR
jgi:threonine/homoserine/homoserine lactone efflux protein